jgi:hypothetical protein
MDDQTTRKLNRKIEQCQAVMERTRLVWDKPFQAIGSFVTGGSNRHASLDRAVDRENNARSKAFKMYQEAEKNLEFYRARLADYVAGEVHANGQPRKDAPSRQRYADYTALRADFMRTLIHAGDMVQIAGTQNQILIRRVNKKSLTSESGSKWDYNEIMPLVNGVPMTDSELSLAFRQWREIMADEHEGTPEVITEPASRIIEAAVIMPAVEVKPMPDAPEHKGELTWERLEKVEARRDAFKAEVETLKAEVQRLVGVYAELGKRNEELVGNVSDLKEDNDRLKEANATYAASLSPTGNATIGAGEAMAAKDVKIAEQAQLIKDLTAQLLKAKRTNPVMTTTPPPAIGVYEYRGMVTEQDGRQGKWWFQPEQEDGKVRQATDTRLIMPGDEPPIDLAALPADVQLSIEGNQRFGDVVVNALNRATVRRQYHA